MILRRSWLVSADLSENQLTTIPSLGGPMQPGGRVWTHAAAAWCMQRGVKQWELNGKEYIYIRMQKDIAGKSSKVWKRYHSLQVLHLQKVPRVTNRSECAWRHWDTDNGWQFGLCLCTSFLWQDVARSWLVYNTCIWTSSYVWFKGFINFT